MQWLTIFSVVFIVSGAFGQPGLPLWQNRQRTHVISTLPQSSLSSLCSMTSIDTLKAYFEPLNKPRIVGTPEHKAAGMYLKRTLDAANFTTEWDRFQGSTPYGAKTFRNLVATYNISAPRRLVLACHYDSKIIEGSTFIGATDSALPCAQLLDLAHTLGPHLASGTQNDVTLQLVFFDGEEAFKRWTDTDSIYGARHLAEKWSNQWYPALDGAGAFHLTKEIERIDVLMLLDLLGASNPIIRNHQGLRAEQHFTSLPSIESSLRSLNCLQQVPQIFHDVASFSLVEDDHIPFMQRGVPILHMITVPFPSVWHKPSDNADALHWPTIHNLQSIFRVFVASYLGLRL